MNASSPRVSIGLPVYNGERYLAATIESLLAQTYRDFELIISDNASTDGTESICRRYAAQDERISYHRSDRNRGGSWNFRQVVALASGKYFRWAAYDDLVAPTNLEACVAPLDANHSVVLCYPRTLVIDEHGDMIGPYDDDLDLRGLSTAARYNRYHLHYRHGAACNPIYGLIRLDVLRRTQVMGTYASSDIVLLGELALHGEFYEVPEQLFLRRDHPQTTLRTYGSAGAGIAWHRPTKAATRWYDIAAHPVLRLLYEHMAALQRAPIPWHTRLACSMILIRWAAWQSRDHIVSQAMWALSWAKQGFGRSKTSQAARKA